MYSLNTLSTAFSVVAISVVLYLVLSYAHALSALKSRQKGRPLPPGPRPLPLIGNLLDLPLSKQGDGLRDLCRKYGDVVYLNICGQCILVIGSATATTKLLEKRSANTSDRHYSTVLDLIGNSAALSVMPYGQLWRDHRRAFWQIFHPGAIHQYRDAQRVILHKFLRKLLASPDNLKEHLRYIFAATMMKVLYNIDAKENGDELVSFVDEATSCTATLATGVHPVDIFPFLRHLPSWVPGAGFQDAFARCRAAVEHLKETPFAALKAALDEGQIAPSGLSVLLSKLNTNTGSSPKNTYQEDVLKNVGLVAFEAGADTSFSTLQAVFLAMSLYPDVLKTAQAELDAVVGPHRLPDYDDRDELSYVNAIITEALRGHVVLPISLPHRTVEDDELDGYFIPAGTIIMPNTWAMLHDPEVYENPGEFKPERFTREGKLDRSSRDPYDFAFGYGRRICPGRHFADESLYLTVASVLHVFDIGPPLDIDGQPITVKYEQTDGLLTYPRDCQCTIKPRSDGAVSLVSGA